MRDSYFYKKFNKKPSSELRKILRRSESYTEKALLTTIQVLKDRKEDLSEKELEIPLNIAIKKELIISNLTLSSSRKKTEIIKEIKRGQSDKFFLTNETDSYPSDIKKTIVFKINETKKNLTALVMSLFLLGFTLKEMLFGDYLFQDSPKLYSTITVFLVFYIFKLPKLVYKPLTIKIDRKGIKQQHKYYQWGELEYLYFNSFTHKSGKHYTLEIITKSNEKDSFNVGNIDKQKLGETIMSYLKRKI